MNDSPAARAARRYIEGVNAADPVAVVALFAEDGEWFGQLAEPHRGTAELTELYGAVLQQVPKGVEIVIGMQVSDGDHSMIVLERRDDPAGARILGVEHFEVNEQGKIRRLNIFGAPRTQ